MATEVKARKFGGSIGAIFPNELVTEKGIREGDIINIEVERNDDLRPLLGLLKGTKISTDKIMQEIDSGELQ